MNNIISFNAIMPIQVISALQNLLEEAITVDKADMGNIQVYNKADETLRIVVQKGFGMEFLEHFKVVKAFDSSACGRAAGIGNVVAVSDVMHDTAFTPHRSIAKLAGFRSVKSVPLLSGGKMLGVLSTHFKDVQWSWQITSLSTQADKIIKLLENNPGIKSISGG